MEKIKTAVRRFCAGEINLSWGAFFIFTISVSIISGLLAVVPAFKNTSLSDSVNTLEWWIVFGVFVIVGSKSKNDSAIKCFLFFLISQPLNYLVRVPFFSGGFAIFHRYPRWFVATFFTLIMGYIGYRIKEDSFLSALILSPMTAVLGLIGCHYCFRCASGFPRHLISAALCFLFIFAITLPLLKGKKRLVPILAGFLSAGITALYLLNGGRITQTFL